MKIETVPLNISVKGARTATKRVKDLTKATRKLSLAMDEFNRIYEDFKEVIEVNINNKIITKDEKMEDVK